MDIHGCLIITAAFWTGHGRLDDVDTTLTLVTLDDGTMGTVSATRCNGATDPVKVALARILTLLLLRR